MEEIQTVYWKVGQLVQKFSLLSCLEDGGFGKDGNIEEGGYIAGGQLVVGQYGKKGWRRVLITRGRNGTATTRHFSSTVLNFGVPDTI